MKEFTCQITAPLGLHARPAGLLVQKAKQFQSRVTVCANGKECEATRLMMLMSLCIKCGTAVQVRVEGADEEACAAAIREFFEQNL